jgi:two-component system, sensor histidine kinase PdtaS
MFKSLCIICFLFCSLNGYNQLKSKKPLSALMIDLNKTKPDSNRVLVLLQITNYYLERVPVSEHKLDSALFFIQTATRITDTLGSQSWKHEVSHCLAKYYLNKGENEKGKSIIWNIIKEVSDNGNTTEEIRWLDDLGDHISLEDTIGITKLDCFKRIALLYDAVKSRKERIEAELNVADIYFLQARYTSSENHILEIIKIYTPLEIGFLQRAYYLLSQINRYRGDLNKALMYSLRCVKGIEENRDITAVDYFFGELALVYQELGLVENSIEWYKKALQIRIKNHDAPFVVYRTAGFLVQQLIK